MSKQIFINIITKDLTKSTAFYEAIGFTRNPQFSSENASAMVWSDEIYFMILTEEFATNFNDGKVFADTKKSVGALFALTLNSRKEVDTFCDNAKIAGGRVYTNKYNQENASDFMYTYEVEDPDGYILEIPREGCRFHFMT